MHKDQATNQVIEDDVVRGDANSAKSRTIKHRRAKVVCLIGLHGACRLHYCSMRWWKQQRRDPTDHLKQPISRR